MLVCWRCKIIGMADKVSGEDSGDQEWLRRCETIGMDTSADEMWDGNR